MSYLSFSTWSLHRILGPLRWTAWNAETSTHDTHEQDQPQIHSLLELPAEAARRGYQAIEVCHFHFPHTDTAYLAKIRQAFADAGISFDTLLLDYGDITATDESRQAADLSLIREWIEIASRCGAKQIRIIAGEAAPDDAAAIRRSSAALAELAVFSASLGVRVITENFKPLTSTGSSCLQLLKQAGPAVGMITDFGNFEGSSKYEELAMILPYSVSVHAKAAYDELGLPDETEFVRCLDTVSLADYNGAFVLIYDGPGDMWEGLERVKSIVKRYI